MDKIARIRQKIEELYDGEAPKHAQQCDFDDGYFTGIGAISKLLDTLSEEPDKSLEEAAEEYARLDDKGVWKDGGKYKGFKAGAKWAMRYQEKKIADAYEKGKQEGVRVVRSWESSPGQGGY